MKTYQLPDQREGEQTMPLGREWKGKSHWKTCEAVVVALEGSDSILVQPDTIVMASEHLSSMATAKGQASHSGVCRIVCGGHQIFTRSPGHPLLQLHAFWRCWYLRGGWMSEGGNSREAAGKLTSLVI